MARPSENSIDMIRRLVGYDTTSRDSNMPLIDWVRDYLAGHGVDSTLIRDDTGTKANLFATLGPQDPPGICLSGHTDVVPVDGQDWDSDPFDLTEKDGRLYGRGTCDMKGFLAIALALVPEFQRRGLQTPLHLAMSHDEEVGCRGVPHMLARFGDGLPRPAMCIVGEPTSMKVVRGHKGKKAFRCDVHGVEAHSSLAPTAVNAIEYAAEIVAFLRRMARRKREEGPLDDGYDIAHTTIQTGVIRGGTAINIVPRHCSFEFEFRVVPADDPYTLFEEVRRFATEELEPEMRAVHPESRIDFTLISGYPGLDTVEDDPVVALAKRLTGANSTYKVAFGTEAGLFQQAEVPTVVCGPGSIDQAHKPNEFVSLDQLAQCEHMMKRLMEQMCRN
jgi:acetylornithine deacetylase